MVFKDRSQAGKLLAKELLDYKGKDALVLALPRGGVPVGAEIARELSAELDIVIPRKIGAPGDPELAIGAVSARGMVIVNEDLVRALGVSDDYIARAVAEVRCEIDRRMRLYRGDRQAPRVHGRTIILVDDGVATGYTMLAAIRGIREEGPGRLVVAVPVAPPDSVRNLEKAADEFIVLATPIPFFAVGQFYVAFEQVSDAEVREILETFQDGRHASGRFSGDTDLPQT